MTGPYDRINYRGHVLNRRTIALYEQSEHIYQMIGGTGGYDLLQGSYNTSVSASGNTHAGGGAVDTEPTVQTAKNWSLVLKAQRLCMFADWDRPTLYQNGKLVWDHHNHGILIGDAEMSQQAAYQIRNYHLGQDGLADNGADAKSMFRPPVIFTPLYPLGLVDLSNIVAQFHRTRGWTALPGVKRIQSALNVKLGALLPTDGLFGPKTKAAYLHFEQFLQGSAADGVPGEFTLTMLGAGRFNVKA